MISKHTLSDQFGLGFFLWLSQIPASHKGSYNKIPLFALHDAALGVDTFCIITGMPVLSLEIWCDGQLESIPKDPQNRAAFTLTLFLAVICSGHPTNTTFIHNRAGNIIVMPIRAGLSLFMQMLFSCRKLLSFTHHHAITNSYNFILSVEHKRRNFGECNIWRMLLFFMQLQWLETEGFKIQK